MKSHQDVAKNVQIHNRLADRYEAVRNDIFNDGEQERLSKSLAAAIRCCEKSEGISALDFGCGSGNLTRHLLSLGVCVCAADVAERFLEKLNSKYSQTGLLTTKLVNGMDLENLENDSFDFIAAYSVLHHVPDYLQIVKEFVRVARPRGIIYIDHEVNDQYWNQSEEYKTFLRIATHKGSIVHSVKTGSFIFHLRRLFNPRYSPDGDIHIFPDDHIEWNKIKETLLSLNCELVKEEDYLLYRSGCDPQVYQRYSRLCSDYKLLVARKTSGKA